jgi:signal transduction histidine kinase
VNRLRTFFNDLFLDKTPDIHRQSSRWKLYLALIGIGIVVISAVYTNYLVGELRKQEEVNVDLYREATELIGTDVGFNDMPEGGIKDFILDKSTLKNINMPLILTDDRFGILDARGFSEIDSNGVVMPRDSAFLYNRLYDLIRANRRPIYVRDASNEIIQKVYYGDSRNLTLLKYYPVFQFILIALFITLGYLGFNSSRRNEQNRVWVGMAKETAHQLGTPIAAIMGWIEHLKINHEEDEMTQDIVKELENDVLRLTLVADRFSKIGSDPELEPTNIYEAIDRCRIYMEKRAPRKVKFDFPKFENVAEETLHPRENRDIVPPYLGVKLNNHLFDWVVENLIRNALDAMEDGKGTITAHISEEANWVTVDISDTGKGIPAGKYKAIFQPGFTTKKRGWGLGLSLAKRIIENYHGGKIFVKDSVIGKGATFSIKLPKMILKDSSV